MTSVASEDNHAGSVQEFLVCTTVHKARNVDLGCSNSELYVCVILDKACKFTRTFNHSEHVFHNESFVFEVKTSLFELLRLTIFYELKKHSTCKKDVAISELLIDLHTVWHQPKHSFFKKWGRLETPIAIKDQIKEEASGYLQIDLAIVTQNSNPMYLLIPDSVSSNLNKWQVDKDYDDIEKNLLQNSYIEIQCNIRYIVTIYHGYFIRKSDYYIQYRFHPFKGKTEIAKNTNHPVWNEELSFAWIFPSLAQQLLLQIYVHEYLQWKPIAECEVHFGEIAFNGQPALGPTFIHLYDSSNPLQYFGRILIEIRSEILKEKVQRQLYTRPTWALDESRFWQTERLQLDFLPIQGDFIHASANLCKLNMRIAEHSSNNVDCVLKTQQDKFKLSPNLRFFRQDIPYKSCVINALMPDNRIKFESDFFMQEVVDYMKCEIETFRLFQFKYNNQFHMQTKCLKGILSGILQKIRNGVADKRFDYKFTDKRTPWEMNRQLYLIDYFAKLPIELTSYRKKLKAATSENIEILIDQVLLDLVLQTSRLNSLVVMARIQDDLPELILSMSVYSKDIGLCRLNAKHFLDMHKSRSINHCWRVRTFIFKDPQCKHSCVNCGCIVATVLGCLAIVNEKERDDFLLHIKDHWLQEGRILWTPKVTSTHFKCNLFVHQAKVRPGFDRSSLCNALLRVVTCEHVAETPIVHGTLSPIWNIVITLPDVILPGDINWYLQNPPLISIEFFDADKNRTNNLVGCGLLMPSIISNDRIGEADWEDARMPNYTFCDFMKSKNAVEKFQRLKNATQPPLKWVPMSKKGSTYAEVLMSAEFVEVIGERCDSMHAEGSVTIGIPTSIRPNMLNFVLEVIFIGLRNYSKTDPLSAGRHRIKIMMAELMLVSGLSTSRIHNSFNFLVAYASGVVNLPDQIEYWPGIVAIDVTIRGSNIEHINGAALVPNSKDFLHKNNNDITSISSPKDTDTSEVTSRSVANATYGTSIAIREETEDESDTEDDSESLPEDSKKYHSCWTVLKIWFGFKPKYKIAKIQNPITEDWDTDTSKLFGERDLSWWAKFYNSMYHCEKSSTNCKKHHLIIYTNDLEKQPEFSGFKDWAIPIDLIEGIGTKRNAPPKEEIYAILKMQISLTPCQLGGDKNGGGDASSILIPQVGAAMLPKYRAKIQKLGELTKIYVRVYIVQALELNSRDIRSKSDSYVKLTLGSKTFSDRASYVPNQCNPLFGRFFEFDCQLPHEHILEISLIDHDFFRDNVIGTTCIDLENRWHSKHRATVGIANEYSRHGYNVWRDAETPVELLSRLCHQQEIEPPMYFGKYVEVDNSQFSDETIIAKGALKDEDINERLALTALKNLKQLSSFRYSLVPEHVETRSLYRDDCPGIEQGKLQLWVEIFDSNNCIPQAIDITPYPPLDFEVRIIVLNLEDVPMHDDDENESSELLSDIYVVGWCQDASNYQSTDVHYQSYAGEANFNWRMVFPMKYSLHEDMMIVRGKMEFSEEFEMKMPPTIYFHVKDKDYILHDDYVSSLELNLSNMPAPYKSARDCKTFFPKQHKHLNLFKRKSVRGWFPLNISSKLRDAYENMDSGGKIELEVQVCKHDEAVCRPVGLGHQPPNALAVPKRTDPSLSPRKSSKKRNWSIYVFFGISICIVPLLVALLYFS